MRQNRGHVRRTLSRLCLAIPGASVLAFLTLPILAIIPMSASDSTVFELVPSNPGISQYRAFLSSRDWMVALGNSIEVALGTTILATILGTLTALALRKLRSRLRTSIETLFVLPQIVPSIVYAVAAYFVFNQIGLVGNLIGLVVAHSVIALPFVVIVVSGAVYSLDPALEDASLSLGAGPVKTFFHVTLPHLRTAVLGSALFAFQISFDEVILALFLTGATSKTLPVKVWSAMLYEVSPILPAISTVIILVPILLSAPFILILNIRRGQRV